MSSIPIPFVDHNTKAPISTPFPKYSVEAVWQGVERNILVLIIQWAPDKFEAVAFQLPNENDGEKDAAKQEKTQTGAKA
jgi:hypothetical protein